MKVKIKHPDGFAAYLGEEPFEPFRIHFDPTRRYAVVEPRPNWLYVAVRVLSLDDELLVGDYVNACQYSSDEPMLQKISVDWSCIEYGFCTVNLWAPELAGEFGGGFDKTLKRFYFDWELYKECYEKRHGVPCRRKDPNSAE